MVCLRSLLLSVAAIWAHGHIDCGNNISCIFEMQEGVGMVVEEAWSSLSEIISENDEASLELADDVEEHVVGDSVGNWSADENDEAILEVADNIEEDKVGAGVGNFARRRYSPPYYSRRRYYPSGSSGGSVVGGGLSPGVITALIAVISAGVILAICCYCQQQQESDQHVQDLSVRHGSKHLQNDEGAGVCYGTGAYHSTFFCGRNLGCRAIPGSDGRCGPSNGPQCASCRRLQNTQSAQQVATEPGYCPLAHQLTWLSHPRTRICDKCRASIPAGERVASCRICNYDECSSCLNSALGARPVPVAASGLAPAQTPLVAVPLDAVKVAIPVSGPQDGSIAVAQVV